MVVGPFSSEIGILVVGHGSRDPEGNVPVLDVCRRAEARLGMTPVQPSFLEFAAPTIESGLAALHRRGVTRAIVVPLQLAAGRHVRYDIPCEVGRCLAEMSDIRVVFSDHLGSHPEIMNLSRIRIDEALGGQCERSGRTEYLLVARGSSDPLVRGEILRVAAAKRTGDDHRGFEPCFLGMTQPSMETAIQIALSRNPDRIIVQPHLLFPGRLYRHVCRRVEDLAGIPPRLEWVTAGPLGPDGRLVDCILDLAWYALERDFHREPAVFG